MTRASQSDSRIKLIRSEKIFTGLGLTMVSISTSIWLASEVFIPYLTVPTWDIASPGLVLLTFIVGTYLFLRGTKRLIFVFISNLDNALKSFVAYRATRWLTKKMLLILLGILAFIFSIPDDESTPIDSKKSETSPICDRGHGAWDVASDHYYDNDPPPPFS